ncbi:hypothetical protein C5708_11905 [Caulobacter sp. CCUG 60055]|uniref:hypothetical protein n=1 Tax=Caulobacter sp. CCUG 60055 TaxID=2100090 RepID=UPI001FA72524|nr:hypothetical protein [Caulobacter sp. CCUG 60055]MBQ1542460.1 hypothetical protein [Caulobacteraceae bacterium]MCI3180961.1 hypothetical protein [Caulobacter sp. CCUG 60055]
MDGRNEDSPIWRRDPDAWAAAMDIDLRAAMVLARATAEALQSAPSAAERLKAALMTEIAQLEAEEGALAAATAALLRDVIEPG